MDKDTAQAAEAEAFKLLGNFDILVVMEQVDLFILNGTNEIKFIYYE